MFVLCGNVWVMCAVFYVWVMCVWSFVWVMCYGCANCFRVALSGLHCGHTGVDFIVAEVSVYSRLYVCLWLCHTMPFASAWRFLVFVLVFIYMVFCFIVYLCGSGPWSWIASMSMRVCVCALFVAIRLSGLCLSLNDFFFHFIYLFIYFFPGNAIQLLGQILNYHVKETHIELLEIEGGGALNVIPREAYALIITDSSKVLWARGCVCVCAHVCAHVCVHVCAHRACVCACVCVVCV